MSGVSGGLTPDEGLELLLDSDQRVRLGRLQLSVRSGLQAASFEPEVIEAALSHLVRVFAALELGWGGVVVSDYCILAAQLERAKARVAELELELRIRSIARG